MLTVDDYGLIRSKHLVDGMSWRAIARELGHARNTVAKAVANPIPLGYRLTHRQISIRSSRSSNPYASVEPSSASFVCVQ